MKRLFGSLLAVLMVFDVLLSWNAEAQQPAIEEERSEAAQLCDSVCERMEMIALRSPSVVPIYGIINTESLKYGMGAAVLVEVEGKKVFLTNDHIIAARPQVLIKYNLYQQVTVLSQDHLSDLAIVSLPNDFPQETPAIKFGTPPKVGMRVYPLGHPYGISSITEGRINSVLRSVTIMNPPGMPMWMLSVTDASINPGNSGGPLFNENHEMVGMSSARIPGAAMGFLISIEYIEKILPRLLREKDVKHAGLGFMFDDTTNLMPVTFQQNGLEYPPRHSGVVVYQVGRAAWQAGVRVGDVITHADGKPVNAEELDKDTFLNRRPGEMVELTVMRRDETLTLPIQLRERPAMVEAQPQAPVQPQPRPQQPPEQQPVPQQPPAPPNP